MIQRTSLPVLPNLSTSVFNCAKVYHDSALNFFGLSIDMIAILPSAMIFVDKSVDIIIKSTKWLNSVVNYCWMKISRKNSRKRSTR